LPTKYEEPPLSIKAQCFAASPRRAVKYSWLGSPTTPSKVGQEGQARLLTLGQAYYR